MLERGTHCTHTLAPNVGNYLYLRMGLGKVHHVFVSVVLGAVLPPSSICNISVV